MSDPYDQRKANLLKSGHLWELTSWRVILLESEGTVVVEAEAERAAPAGSDWGGVSPSAFVPLSIFFSLSSPGSTEGRLEDGLEGSCCRSGWRPGWQPSSWVDDCCSQVESCYSSLEDLAGGPGWWCCPRPGGS